LNERIEESKVEVEPLLRDLRLVERSLHEDVLINSSSVLLQNFILLSSLLYIYMFALRVVVHNLINDWIFYKLHSHVKLCD